MHVLDTDILISFFRNDGAATGKMHSLLENGEAIATTVLNAQELLFGFAHGREKEHDSAAEFLSKIEIIEYKLGDVHEVVSVKLDLKSSGAKIGDFDEVIAGICLSRKATIVTRNAKHFGRVKGLRVETW